jgi:hypothetical protein
MLVEPHLAGQHALIDPVCPACFWAEEEEEDRGRLCPHGRPPAECGACLVDSDLAYDADREARIFGR